jgi:hypothetical protein
MRHVRNLVIFSFNLIQKNSAIYVHVCITTHINSKQQ